MPPPPVALPRRLTLPCLFLAWALLAAVLAGCASGPGGGRVGASSQGAGNVPAVTARNPDRDGPPLDPPSDLARSPDPVPQVEPIRTGGPNKPYAVLGQSYTPEAADVPFKQRGMASWYGTKFHGRKTASGEVFSVYALTAAHRTLPIPSYIRVRSLATGKEVIVRVNDRGPFHSSRILDLSYAAAAKLGILAYGPTEVEIERLTFDDIRTGAWRRSTPAEPGSPQVEPAPAALAQQTPAATGPLPSVPAPDSSVASPMASTMSPEQPAVETQALTPAAVAISDVPARAYTPTAQGFWVQLAALGREEGVDRLQQRINDELQALAPMLAVFHESALFKLQVGPYGSREQALAVARQARDTLQLNPMVVERR